jgi:hypothetical protein
MGLTRRLSRVGALVMAIAIPAEVTGCAATCPHYEDRGWRELTTANFRLRTDLGEADARANLESFETLRAALLTVFGAPADTRLGRTEVTVLDRGWSSVGGTYLNAFFTSNLGFPQIAMGSSGTPFGQDTVKHELVHQLSHVLRPDEPVWLAEGLAQYFETLELSDDQHLVVGRPDPQTLRMVQQIGIMPVADLRAAVDVHAPDSLFHPSAWLLVHYLMNQRLEALQTYQRLLARGRNEPAAWAEAFADLPPGELDQRLRRYVEGGQYYVFNYPFRAPRMQVVATGPVDPAEAHATRAMIYAGLSKSSLASSDMMPLHREELQMCARQELDEAFRGDADNPLGLMVQSQLLAKPVGVTRAQSSADKHPSDWRAWFLVVMSLQESGADRARTEAAIDKTLDLTADNPAINLKVVRRTPR